MNENTDKLLHSCKDSPRLKYPSYKIEYCMILIYQTVKLLNQSSK